MHSSYTITGPIFDLHEQGRHGQRSQAAVMTDFIALCSSSVTPAQIKRHKHIFLLDSSLEAVKTQHLDHIPLTPPMAEGLHNRIS
jgi:hypothetical protein